MRFGKSLLTGGLVLSLIACQTLDADNDRPARIVDPTEASRSELQRVIDAALHTHVRLAENALTTSSVLTIEHTPPATMQTPVADGRVMGKPIQFRLVLNASTCVLIDQRDAARYELKDTRCVVE